MLTAAQKRQVRDVVVRSSAGRRSMAKVILSQRVNEAKGGNPTVLVLRRAKVAQLILEELQKVEQEMKDI